MGQCWDSFSGQLTKCPENQVSVVGVALENLFQIFYIIFLQKMYTDCSVLLAVFK